MEDYDDTPALPEPMPESIMESIHFAMRTHEGSLDYKPEIKKIFVSMCSKWIISGFNQPEIIFHIKNAFPAVPPKEIQGLISEAQLSIDSFVSQSQEVNFNRAMAKYDLLFQQAVQMNDPKTAVAILDKQVVLNNLPEYAKSKVKVDDDQTLHSIALNYINGNK